MKTENSFFQSTYISITFSDLLQGDYEDGRERCLGQFYIYIYIYSTTSEE